MKEKKRPEEKVKKTYQKPELVEHGSVEKITEELVILQKGQKNNLLSGGV